MKKILFFTLCISLLNSCARSDNYNDSFTNNVEPTNTAHKGSSNSPFLVSLNANPLDKCSGGYTPVNLEPDFPYYDNFNVYCYDGYVGAGGACDAIGNNKPCIDLSHFLSIHGAHNNIKLNNNSVNKIAVFYGDSQLNSFNSYTPSGSSPLTVSHFTIGAESNSYFFTGGVGGTMPNDAANTVLHYFQNQILSLPVSYHGSQVVLPNVVAVHYSVNAWLCIPPLREVKMSIKYRY